MNLTTNIAHPMMIDDAIKEIIVSYQFYRSRKDPYTARRYSESEAVVIALWETFAHTKGIGGDEINDEEVNGQGE